MEILNQSSDGKISNIKMEDWLTEEEIAQLKRINEEKKKLEFKE